MLNREQRRAARRIKRPAPARFKPWERLSDSQVQDLALCHLVNLDAISKGQGTEATLYQWIGGVLTWHHVSRLVHLHEADMDEQLALARAMIRRHHVDGRIGFTGPEYQLANRSEKLLAQMALPVEGVAA